MIMSAVGFPSVRMQCLLLQEALRRQCGRGVRVRRGPCVLLSTA
jgi:hypothetical protein